MIETLGHRMQYHVLGPEAAVSLRYADAAANAFVDPDGTGLLRPDLSESDRAAFTDVTAAIHILQAVIELPKLPGLIETSNTVPLIGREVTKFARDSLRGIIRRRRADAFLWDALSAFDEPRRHDPSLPTTIPRDIERHIVYQRPSFGVAPRVIAKLVGV
jgi:hypothetical protein